MFGAVISWALYTVLGRKVLGGLSPLAATNYAALWGTLMLGLVAAPQFGDAARRAVRLAHGRLAAVPRRARHRAGLRLVLHVRQEAAARRSRSIFNNLVPVFGVAISVLVLGEPLLPSMLVGGAVAIAGVFMVSRA